MTAVAEVAVRDPGIEVTDLTVRFEGNVAVDTVSLSAPMGRLTGLIGLRYGF